MNRVRQRERPGLHSPAVAWPPRRSAGAFELWCCRRLLRVPWTARRSNQSILKDPVQQLSPTQAAMVTTAPFHRASFMVCKASRSLPAQPAVPEGILKEISPGISLEGMMLKLKLQYFGHLMQTVDSLEKILMLGWTGGKRRRGRQRMR